MFHVDHLLVDKIKFALKFEVESVGDTYCTTSCNRILRPEATSTKPATQWFIGVDRPFGDGGSLRERALCSARLEKSMS